MGKVALEKCASYERTAVEKSVIRTLAAVGGMESFVRPGNRVLLKVNMLSGYAPERAVTTHPEIVRAVANEVLRVGGVPIIGDSPGGPLRPMFLSRAYSVTGFAKIAQELGIEVSTDTGEKRVSTGEGKSFEITEMTLKADVVISLAKLKTHQLTTLTCAVKNIFGCVAGLHKMEYHARYPKVDDFCGMLVDLCETVQPALSIVDGVVAMEGHGPAGGAPRAMNAVVAGVNPHEVDSVCARMIGLDAERVLTLKHAIERGLLDEDAIAVIGEKIESMAVSNYDIPMARKDSALVKGAPRFVKGLMDWASKVRPVFPKSCPCCGTCLDSCPVRAITYANGAPQLSKGKCISCFCCQELCPKQCIRTSKSVIVRLLGGKA